MAVTSVENDEDLCGLKEQENLDAIATSYLIWTAIWMEIGKMCTCVYHLCLVSTINDMQIST